MTRACGSCQLCCRLLPVQDIKLHKKAGVRCDHQRHRKGCAIYNSPAMPPSCRLWSCAWLVGNPDEVAGLSRPDHSHYVVDIVPDYLTITNKETGEQLQLPVIQVWLDPNYPDAHRDPALRAMLAEQGKRGFAALVRLDNRRGFTLLPPTLPLAQGEWRELPANMGAEREHTGAEVAAVLRAANVSRESTQPTANSGVLR